jgi:hypothetical protein
MNAEVDEILIEAIVKKVLDEQKQNVAGMPAPCFIDGEQGKAHSIQVLARIYSELSGVWNNTEEITKAKIAIGAILKELI